MPLSLWPRREREGRLPSTFTITVLGKVTRWEGDTKDFSADDGWHLDRGNFILFCGGNACREMVNIQNDAPDLGTGLAVVQL